MAAIQLETWDYVVLFGIVFITSVPGLVQVYRSKKIKSDLEFSGRGDRHSSNIAIAMSIAATRIGVSTYLALANDVYRQGAIFMWYIFGMMIAIPIGATIYLPVFFNNGVVSVFEYLEHRFDVKARKFVSGIFCIRSMFSTSLSMYTGALALNTVTGINIWTCAALTNVTCIIYASLGGFKAVLFTDVMQLSVVCAALLCVVIKGYMNAGGFLEVWQANKKGHRTNIFLLDSALGSGLTLWPLFFGGFFASFGSNTKQRYIQRYMHSQSLVTAARSAVYGWAIVATVESTIISLGLVMYAAFSGCDPLLAGKIKSQDQREILFVADTLTFAQGLLGLFFAGLVCSSISTFSTSINTYSSQMMEDFVKPMFPKLSPKKYLIINKILGALYAGGAFLLISIVRKFRGVYSTFLTISGTFSGPTIGLYTLGMLSPWTGTLPALIGTAASTLCMIWIAIGRLVTTIPPTGAPLSTTGCNITDTHTMSNVTISSFNSSMIDQGQGSYSGYFPLSGYSPFWYQFWSISMTIGFGLIATLIVGPKNPEDTHSKFVFTFVTWTIRKLPKKLQTFFGFKLENSSYLHIDLKIDNTTSMSTVKYLEKEKKNLLSTKV